MAEVAKCPKCGKSIDETHENSWCTECGEPLPEGIKSLLPKLVALRAASSAVASGDDSASANTQSSSPIVNRYRDAYRVGAALVGVGNAIKLVGAVLAGIIVLGSMSSANSPFGSGALVPGIFLAAVVGVLCWVCGVMVAAQGQILQATLDTAVASSRFLTDPERADAMGLPRSVASGG
jgi:hypothetical protein